MSKFSIDSSEFDEVIHRLVDKKNVMSIEKKAVRKGLAEIKKTSKDLLRKALPNSLKRSDLYDDRLIDGVMSSVSEEGDSIIGKVHVMGTRRRTSGTFRLRFFEGGTKDRIVKKTGKSAGHIGALNFFNSAVTSSESSALKKIEDEWDKEINKLIN